MTLQVPARWLDTLYTAAGKAPYLADIERNPKQLAFVTDQADRKSAVCGRRGGKTTGIAGWLYEGMLLQPGTTQLYIALSRGTARRILWDNVMAGMKRSYGLPLKETTIDGQLVIKHPNGSSLWIAGCDDKREVEKFRGQPYFRVNIDEAQGFPDEILQSLVEDAIGPALGDYDGQMALTGTPSPLDVGYFHEVSTGVKPGWSHNHHWTVRDNPWFLSRPAKKRPEFANRAEEYLATHAEQLGGVESLTFRREYLGEWVHDAAALIYPFTDKNRWEPENDAWPYGLNPEAEWVFGLGVDLGYSEGAKTLAFTLAAKQRDTGNGYLLKSYLKDRMYPGKLAEYCRDVREKVARETGCGLRIVVDEGGLGGGWTEQMQMLGVQCEAAEKSEKRAYQEYVGGLVASGQLKAHFPECADLMSEARKLAFDPETGKEDESFRRHCCDSMLYIVRALFPKYSAEEHGPQPQRGTPGWEVAEMGRDLERKIREREKRRRKG